MQKSCIKQQAERQQGRIIYFDILRIISMFAVIVIHAAASNWYTADVDSFPWIIYTVYDSMACWAVPVFTMISGALFLDNRREISIKTLYTKNIFRIITAFFFWSIVYALRNQLDGGHTIQTFVKNVFFGHYHMWFLPMIIGLYLITPLLRRITEDRKATCYFLALSFVFTFLIPAFFEALTILNAFFDTEPLYSLAKSVYDNVYFHFTLGYSAYFVLGHYLNTTEFNKKERTIIYVLGIAGFLATALFTIVASCYAGHAIETFLEKMSINVMLEGVAVFVFAKNSFTNKKVTIKHKRTFSLLSKYSFGVYLVHVFFLEEIQTFGVTTNSFYPVLSVPIIALFAFIMSLGTSAILNQIPFVREYFV